LVLEKITIAIDGYSSCGKSTLAKQLAKKLNYTYVDTGAMFRAVALYCLRNGLITSKGDEVYKIKDFIDDILIDFKVNEQTKSSEVTLNGEPVEGFIRNLEVSNAVTKISGIKEVRQKLGKLQIEIGKNKGVVMDGRDIGTTIFPDAELKIFMTASTDKRVKRRYDELRSRGESVTPEQVRKNLEIRDHDDTTRKESPLRMAEDAVVIDNTNLSKNDQLRMIVALAEQRIEEVNKEKATAQ
jgi:cytidylate kinase